MGSTSGTCGFGHGNHAGVRPSMLFVYRFSAQLFSCASLSSPHPRQIGANQVAGLVPLRAIAPDVLAGIAADVVLSERSEKSSDHRDPAG
jgi:hypothetical protein